MPYLPQDAVPPQAAAFTNPSLAATTHALPCLKDPTPDRQSVWAGPHGKAATCAPRHPLEQGGSCRYQYADRPTLCVKPEGGLPSID